MDSQPGEVSAGMHNTFSPQKALLTVDRFCSSLFVHELGVHLSQEESSTVESRFATLHLLHALTSGTSDQA